MKLLPQIDFFGQQFHFLINSDTHFHTALGGILSILSVILFSILGYLFGKDLWYRRNPKVYESLDLKENYTRFYMTDNQLFFPFAFKDYSGKIIDLENTLFLSLTYNNLTNSPEHPFEYTIENIKLTKCKDYKLSVNNFPTNNYDEYYCINFTNRYLLGGVDSEIFTYMSFKAFFCPPEMEKFEQAKCSNLEEIYQLFARRVYFTYYLPKFYSHLDNYSYPIQMEYELTSIEISLHLGRREKVAFTEINVIDDTKLFFSGESRRRSYWEGENAQPDIVFSNIEDLADGAKNIPILSILLINTSQLRIITRSYMKLMELISLLGGFITVSRIVLSFICYYVNFYEQIAFLFWNSFDFTDSNLNIFEKFTDDSRMDLRKANSNVSGGLSAFNKKISKDLAKKNKFFSTDQQIVRTFIKIKNETRTQKAFSFYDNFYDICCAKNKKIQNYFKKFGFDFILKRFDILTYNKLMKNFNIVRQMVLTKEQNIAINLSKNPSLFSVDELENYFGILGQSSKFLREKELCLYFKDKNMDKLDIESQYMYSILDKATQNKIFLNNTNNSESVKQ